MATFSWSSLVDGQVIGTFDPNSDVLDFDDAAISAAEILVDTSGFNLVISFGGKTVTVSMTVFAVTTTNITFADGSMLLIGDNTTGFVDDGAANTLTGGSGDDQLKGLGGNDSLLGGDGSDVLWGDGSADTLTGGLGDDTLDGGDGTQDWASYAAASGAVTVDLGAGTATGADGNDTLLNIEHVEGGDSGDTLTGNATQNFLRGNLGDDTLDGGGQDLDSLTGDTADYFEASSAVTVDLGAGTATGADGNDTLINIESARGSDFDDTLIGSSGNNFLRGGMGDDELDGGAGAKDFADYRDATAGVTVSLATNTSSGADGADTLINIEGISGSDFNDTLTGSTEDDWFRGRNGADSINGGGGFDIVTYRSADGVTVNLGAGTATGTEGSDTLTSIEGVEGSMFNDTLTGANGVNNALYGLGGNDLLRVTQGADTLDGGADSDTIDFTQVTGVAYGGATAVSVNLATHVADLNRSAAGDNSMLVSIETAFGTAGNDVFTGGDAAHGIDSVGNRIGERFRGNAGNDSITGGSGTDFSTTADYANNTNVQAVNANLHTGVVVDGLGGTDTLVNVDALRGGAGNDSLAGGSLSRSPGGTFFEIFRGNAGNDTINGANIHSGGIDSSGDRADYANNTDTQAVNVNLGTGIALDGLGGTDTLIDIDQVFGGAGNDTLTGGSENDALDGGAGNDTLNGAAGSDTARFDQSTAGVIVNLSAGSITVNAVIVAAATANDGMGGTDTLLNMENVRGSDFDDHIRGSDSLTTRQFLAGDAGDDTIDGGMGIDFANYSDVALDLGGLNAFIQNGSGTVNDKKGGTDTLSNVEGLAGTHSNDTLAGGLGNQWFRGNGGSDSINGGSGSDWVLYSNSPLGVTVNLATGTAADGWNGAGGLLALGGTDTLVSIENAEASDYNDSIIGTAGANELRGRDGNDTLNGGAAADTLVGGLGNEIYIVDVAGDIVTELASEGTDLIQSSVSIALLAANVEKLTLTGALAINGTGNTLANTITGNNAANVLNGGTGADALIGLGGGDTYVVDNAGDVVTEAGAGTDLIQSSVSIAVLAANVEKLTLTGALAINGKGNTLANTITGNNAANVLNGGTGADALIGLGGGDTYVVDNAGDVVTEAVVVGVDLIQSSVTILGLAANVEKLTLTGALAINGTGNTLANTITGNNAANVLNGGTGNDTLLGLGGNDVLGGGAGRDTLTGGAGLDKYDFNTALIAATNVDRITDYSLADDLIRLDNDFFVGLATGALAGAAYYEAAGATAAHDASDRIIYNLTSGNLYFDADGTGGASSAVLFATLTGAPNIGAADFLIIA